MEWYDLTDDELAELLGFDESKQDVREITSPNVRQVIVGDLFCLKEHAFGTYWQRQFDRCESIGDDIFSELLSHLFYATAACLLGDLAAAGKITNEQCRQIIDLFEEDEWANRQAKVRLLLNDLKQRITLTDIETIKNEIDQFIHLRACWSVKELLPHLKTECLNWLLKDRMESRDVFSRSNRHDVRELIKKQLVANSQARARQLLDNLKPRVSNMDIETIKKEIDELIQLNASWAVQDLVPHLNKECLNWLLQERMESKTVFKKGDRNNVREFIKRQLRNMDID